MVWGQVHRGFRPSVRPGCLTRIPAEQRGGPWLDRMSESYGAHETCIGGTATNQPAASSRRQRRNEQVAAGLGQMVSAEIGKNLGAAWDTEFCLRISCGCALVENRRSKRSAITRRKQN
jgi:hypothetical protein